MATSKTKKVRGSALKVGMSIGGSKIIKVTPRSTIPAWPSQPWTTIIASLEDGGSYSAGSSEWVEIDRPVKEESK